MGEVEMEEQDIKDGEKDIKKFNRRKKNKNGHKLTSCRRCSRTARRPRE